MIVNGFFNILYVLLLGMFALLPSSDGLPTDVSTAFATLLQQAYAWEYILPLDTLLTVAGLAVSFHFAIFVFKLFNWVLNKVRGSG